MPRTTLAPGTDDKQTVAALDTRYQAAAEKAAILFRYVSRTTTYSA